jgi:hypothetical protein
MKKGRIGFGTGAALLCVALWLAGTGEATATLKIQKQAKELGFKTVTNCQSCHVAKLPKKGDTEFNERGKWLVDEKDKRKPKEVDAAWLKDYVEKKADEKN